MAILRNEFVHKNAHKEKLQHAEIDLESIVNTLTITLYFTLQLIVLL